MTNAPTIPQTRLDQGKTPDSLGITTQKLGVVQKGRQADDKTVRSFSSTPSIDDLVDHAGELLPDRRVAWCGKMFRRGTYETTVQYNADAGRARFSNLCYCGDPACLRCAIRQSEDDKCEVSWACSDPRLTPVLGTFTASHSTSDDLKEWAEKFDHALEATNDKRFRERLERVYGLRYTIWARDHTAGGINGHHQHRAKIYFLDPVVLAATAKADGATIEDEIKEFEVEMKLKFESCLQKTGLTASYSRGFVLSSKEHDIKEYIASHGRIPKPSNMNWDIEHELTLSVKKQGRKQGGKHPFELLVESYHGNMRSRALFVQWARFMYRKHAVNWSKGARDYFLNGKRPYLAENHPEKVGVWSDIMSLPKEVFFELLKLKLIAAFLFEVTESSGEVARLLLWLERNANLKIEHIDLSDIGRGIRPGESDNGESPGQPGNRSKSI